MESDEKSNVNYGTAVILCGVFGVLGIHHFYMRNYVHGMVDLGLFLLFVTLMIGGSDGLALLVLLVDGLHSLIVFYLLITEQARDGDGRLVKLN